MIKSSKTARRDLIFFLPARPIKLVTREHVLPTSETDFVYATYKQTKYLCVSLYRHTDNGGEVTLTRVLATDEFQPITSGMDFSADLSG